MAFQKLNTQASYKPVVMAFMGIPGSGKTTIASHLSEQLSIKAYLEKEEYAYPAHIKDQFTDRNKHGYLDVYNYFRNMHVQDLAKAFNRKSLNQSAIVDCYFDKLLYPLLAEKQIDWFVDSAHADFSKILEIAKNDYYYLPTADILIFLSVNPELHKTLIKKRGRESEMNLETIHASQKLFLEECQNYAIKYNKPLIIIEQEPGIEQVTQKLLNELLTTKTIELVT